jgi:predicted N-acetyltransferase YhbS
MLIETASWNDILPILRTNFRIWSPGLSESDYQHYIWSQLQTPWARRNLRYILYRDGGETKATCKTYRLTLRSRSKVFNFAVLGAVFTQEKFRGKGLAKDLIALLIDQFQEQSFDGVLLFSDIDPDFYRSMGFVQMGSREFAMFLPHEGQIETEADLGRHPSAAASVEYHTLTAADSQIQNKNAAFSYHLDPGIESEVLAEMTRHYARWLRRQPFGVERSEEYFAYRLGRERFIAMHSKLGWPEMIVTITKLDCNEYGYALTECSGMTMRILEVVGSPTAKQELWRQLLAKALRSGIKRIRGWESIISDFAPAFSYQSILPETCRLKASQCRIYSYERDWGRPMMLAINEEARSCLEVLPCPLLELDL